MARRSRADMERERKEKKEKAESTQERIFSVGLYARLSVENSGKSEGKDVMSSQIECCKEYIAKHPDLSLTNMYCDDGATGTNFKRDGFIELMEDIDSGKIDCVLVRDLARFGRNHLESGILLEQYFPSVGVRFIAVQDNYDNFAKDNVGAMLPLKNIINELYAIDTSRKVSSALQTQMKQGKFRPRNLAYGYMWNETRDKVIVDETVAPFVKMIFQWKLEGLSVNAMRKQLDELKAPIPTFRKVENGVRASANGISTEKWAKTTIHDILVNPHYVGDTALGRSERAYYLGIKPHKVHDKDKWYIYPNTHPALVTREDFEAVQEILRQASELDKVKREKSKKQRAKIVNLLTGKVFCGDCGSPTYFRAKQVDYKGKKEVWTGQYDCKKYLTGNGCVSHHTRQDGLEEKILSAIKTQVKVALDYEKLLENLRDSKADKSVREKQNTLIASLKLKVNSTKQRRSRLYEDFTDGILSQEEYDFTKKSYDNDFSTYTLRLNEAIQRKKEYEEAISSDNKWISLMKSVSKAKKLTQTLVDTAIERVNIFEDGSIELVMKYTDIFLLMQHSVEEMESEVA